MPNKSISSTPVSTDPFVERAKALNIMNDYHMYFAKDLKKEPELKDAMEEIEDHIDPNSPEPEAFKLKVPNLIEAAHFHLDNAPLIRPELQDVSKKLLIHIHSLTPPALLFPKLKRNNSNISMLTRRNSDAIDPHEDIADSNSLGSTSPRADSVESRNLELIMLDSMLQYSLEQDLESMDSMSGRLISHSTSSVSLSEISDLNSPVLTKITSFTAYPEPDISCKLTCTIS